MVFKNCEKFRLKFERYFLVFFKIYFVLIGFFRDCYEVIETGILDGDFDGDYGVFFGR